MLKDKLFCSKCKSFDVSPTQNGWYICNECDHEMERATTKDIMLAIILGAILGSLIVIIFAYLIKIFFK